MRQIYKASIVILLTDIYTRLPITNAVILCNGKQNPYTRKPDGYYVFSNLYPLKYNIDIMCAGYTDINFPVTLRENETRIIMTDMPYTVGNPLLTNVDRFEFSVKKGGEPFAQKEIYVKLENPLSFLKLVNPVEPDSEDIPLNVDLNRNLMVQRYKYNVGEKEYDMFFSGYDNDKKTYILKDPAPEKIETEGEFRIYWKLKTDKSGRAVLPHLKQFMKEEDLSFKISAKDQDGNASVTVKDTDEKGRVFYIDVQLD
ncbi:MAG: hypothetical protein LBR79_00350 [Oscillospiraceae bacterium]|jgi:hypothetical protein|nr:hypothetical protein [Oscillospiraceae bacterium]